MRPPRGLTSDEAEAWARVAATVTPLGPLPAVEEARGRHGAQDSAPAAPAKPSRSTQHPLHRPSGSPPPRGGEERARPSPGLDSHWDRRFRAGSIEPDFTLDLHGLTLDGAHARLDDGLAQAKAMGARVVLLIAGKPRPAEAADRGSQRGAIRAKILDWLAAGPHGSSIAAVRKAHRRHGGEGALYLVLTRRR